MKTFVMAFLGALLGSFAALLIYGHFVVAPGERTSAAASASAATAPAVTAPAIGAEQSREDEIIAKAEQARQALKKVGEEMEIQTRNFDRRNLAREALARTSPHRTALTEYLLTMGEWPADANAAGLPPPEGDYGPAVQAITVGKEGQVTVVLRAPFAPGSLIVMTPHADPNTMQVSWHCSTQGDGELSHYLPDCPQTADPQRYTGAVSSPHTSRR